MADGSEASNQPGERGRLDPLRYVIGQKRVAHMSRDELEQNLCEMIRDVSLHRGADRWIDRLAKRYGTKRASK